MEQYPPKGSPEAKAPLNGSGQELLNVDRRLLPAYSSYVAIAVGAIAMLNDARGLFATAPSAAMPERYRSRSVEQQRNQFS